MPAPDFPANVNSPWPLMARAFHCALSSVLGESPGAGLCVLQSVTLVRFPPQGCLHLYFASDSIDHCDPMTNRRFFVCHGERLERRRGNNLIHSLATWAHYVAFIVHVCLFGHPIRHDSPASVCDIALTLLYYPIILPSLAVYTTHSMTLSNGLDLKLELICTTHTA